MVRGGLNVMVRGGLWWIVVVQWFIVVSLWFVVV